MRAFTLNGSRVSERQACAHFVDWVLEEHGMCETIKGAEQRFSLAVQGEPTSIALVERSGLTVTALHRFELTIWERAEHWRFHETVRAVSEQDARAQFSKAYGRGYRLEHIHSLG